ncbi:glycosyltransferase [Massilia sp. SR12]
MFNIIIPTHDRPALLRRTLQTLAAQTFTDFHAIIVDDVAPSAPPLDALAALQGRYTYVTRSSKPGPAESRNAALALCDRPWLLYIDDDDTMEPGHLAALAAQVAASQPDILFHDFKVQNEDRTVMPPRLLEAATPITIADASADSVHVLNRIPNSCLLYRRELIADLRFDTEMIIYEDWDYLLACLKRGKLQYAPGIHSVVIHKSAAGVAENMRRGNSRDDLIVPTMLQLYRSHPAPSPAVRQARFTLLSNAGIPVTLEQC